MLQTRLVQTEAELDLIYALNQANLKDNLGEEERREQGFVTWLYTPALLRQLHQLAPSVIVMDGNRLAGYALVTLKEAAVFHADLAILFRNLAPLQYQGLPLLSHSFYCMGQVCIAKNYRGRGVFDLLYAGHKENYASRYRLLVTEISTSNVRSQKAHERVGFKTIYTQSDHLDDWNVVVWDWLNL